MESFPGLQHVSAHGEGTVFPLSSYSYNFTLAGIDHINHRTAVTASRSLLPISFPFLAVTGFHLSENISISNWDYPSPFSAHDWGSQSLFPTPWPLLSFAFPEAVPCPFNDFLDFSFALCCFSFAASWGPRLKPHSLLFRLLILLFLFPYPFFQSNTRKKCLEYTSQPFNWRH